MMMKTKLLAAAVLVSSLAVSAPAFALDPYAALPVFLAGSAPASAFGTLSVNVDPPNKDDSYSGNVNWGKDRKDWEYFYLKPFAGGYKGTISGPGAQKQNVTITISDDGSIFAMTSPEVVRNDHPVEPWGDGSPGAMLTAVPNKNCGYNITIKWMSGATQHFAVTQDTIGNFHNVIDFSGKSSLNIWDYRTAGGGYSAMFTNAA